MKEIKDELEPNNEPPESAANVDWNELFREFVDSPFIAAQPFLRLKLGSNVAHSGWVVKKVIGWAKEKKDHLDELHKRAMERVKGYKEENLVAAKKLYVEEMRERIITKGHRLSHKEMASNLRAIKTELGEPSIITKQNIVEEPIDDEEAFNRLMGHYEKHTAKTVARKRSKNPKR